MICYKDMTFCPFHEDCLQGDDCHRAMTREVYAEADRRKLPICQFIAPPVECFDPKYKHEDGVEI